MRIENTIQSTIISVSGRGKAFTLFNIYLQSKTTLFNIYLQSKTTLFNINLQSKITLFN